MKYYVVWVGETPGIYDNWPDAQAQISHWPGARYKSFKTLAEATEAYRSGDAVDRDLLFSLMMREDTPPPAAKPAKKRERRPVAKKEKAANQPKPDAPAYGLAVDASCMGNPGVMEYRGVDLTDGHEVFRIGPMADGTNNIGEYLAIIHALALLKRYDDPRPVYSDSRTALVWLRRRGARTTLKHTARNARIFELLERADKWVQTNTWPNDVVKWDTETFGEIPADFDRK